MAEHKLWSKEIDGQLPRWLTEEEKARCYCDDRGWVLVHLDGNEEVIVAANTLNDPGERHHGLDEHGYSKDPDRNGNGVMTYSLGRSTSSVNEGRSVSIQLTTTYVADGTQVPYTIEGIDAQDLVSGQLSGNFEINSGSAFVNVAIKEDSQTEGIETFVLKLNTGESVSININDTSISVPTYTLSAPASISEGQELTITLDTQDVNDGQIGYQVTGIDENDLEIGSDQLTGTFYLDGGTATAVFQLSDDISFEEGDETLTLSLDNGQASINVNIVDSSTATPSYSLSTLGDVTFVNEGDSLTISLSTQYVSSGTAIPYTLGGSVDLANDFDSAVSSTGQFVVGSNESITFNLKEDLSFEEGDEILTLSLDGLNTQISVVVKDTSKATEVYTLSAPASINEGETLSITLNTQYVSAGTVINYTLGGSVDLANDFDSTVSSTGQFVIGTTETLNLDISSDLSFNEGDETLSLTLENSLGSVSVNVIDSSTALPSYILSAVGSINEGEDLTITLNTQYVNDGPVAYTISGIDDNDLDIAGGSAGRTGNINISTNTGSIVLKLKSDLSFNEGSETLTLTLDNGEDAINVTVVDSSTATPVYTLSAPASIDEGEDLTITLTTQHVNDGTVGYTITGIQNADLDTGSAGLSGNFSLSGGTDSIVLKLKEDLSDNENNENLVLSLNNGEDSISVTIVDTSKAPIYNLTSSPQISVDEGVTLRISLSTQNVSETSIPYSVSGGIDNNDLEGNSDPLTGGSFNLDSNGDGFVEFHIKEDSVTEGTENLVLTLTGLGEQISVNVLDTSKERIWNLSTSHTSPVNEGTNLFITLQTQNVEAGDYAYEITSDSGFGSTDLEDDSDDLSGVFTITGATNDISSDSITLKIRKDYSTDETDETITISLPNVDAVADIDVVINDSSTLTPTEDGRVGQTAHYPTISGDGQYLAFTPFTTSAIQFWKYDSSSGLWADIGTTATPRSTGFYNGIGGGSFNGDGSLLAMSSPNGSNAPGGIGYIDIYERNGETFTLRETITGTTPRFGFGVALSDDGLTLVSHDYLTKNLETFKWENNQWNSVDNVNIGVSCYGEIDITPDGKRLVAPNMSSNYVRVYDWVNGSWSHVDTITSTRTGHRIYGAQITNNGNTIVFADNGYHIQNELEIWDYDGTNWNQRGSNIIAPDWVAGNFNRFIYMATSEPINGTIRLVSTKGYVYNIPASLNAYSISGPDSIDEDQDLTLTLNTLGVNGDIGYQITGISGSDLRAGSAPLTGNFSVANETGSITLKLKEDADLAPGSLTITVDQGGDNEVSKTVTINDITSSYILTATNTINGAINEGQDLIINLSTTNVSGSVPYEVTGNYESEDFDAGGDPLSGNFTLDQNGDSFVTFKIKADETTDGPESLTLTLTGTSNQISITINDTSIEPSSEVGVITHKGGMPAISGDSTVISTNVWVSATANYNGLSRGEVKFWDRNPVDNTITERYTLPRPDGASATSTDTTKFGRENVSINSDGTLVAISATGDGNGKVYIYEWDDVNQLYEIRDEILAPESNNFGYCSLSGDGLTLIVGSSTNNKVYTYEYNTGTGNWDPKTSAEFTIPSKLSSVSISNINKDVLIVGSAIADTVYTYDWNGSSWVHRTGKNVVLDTAGYGDGDWGHTLSLSNDGNTMAISSGSSSYTWHVWDWVDNQWVNRLVGEDDTSGLYNPLGYAIGASGVNNGIITLVVLWKRNSNSEVRVVNIPQNPS